MGKAEGSPLVTDKMPWHGHVTAVTVDPDYRRLGLADGLMHGILILRLSHLASIKLWRNLLERSKP